MTIVEPLPIAQQQRAPLSVRVMQLDCILHRPDEKWPPIDPQGWVTELHYAPHGAIRRTVSARLRRRLVVADSRWYNAAILMTECLTIAGNNGNDNDDAQRARRHVLVVC